MEEYIHRIPTSVRDPSKVDEEVNYAVGKNLYRSNQVGRKKEKGKKRKMRQSASLMIND